MTPGSVGVMTPNVEKSPEATIAEHGLAKWHVFTGPHVPRLRAICLCGYKVEVESERSSIQKARELIAPHVVSRLRDAGHTIMPRVEPTDTKDYSEGGEGEDYLGWEVQHGPYFVAVYDADEVQAVDYARDLAAVLLSAAAAAVPAVGKNGAPS